MDSFVERFNAVKPAGHITFKVGDLDSTVDYPIIELKRVDTKYGVSVLATLYDPESQEKFKVFLPRRYADVLKEGEEIPTNLCLRRGDKIDTNGRVMEQYCCDERCFRVPEDQVDGMACRRCRSFSYCRCRCRSFNHPNTTKETPRYSRSICWLFILGIMFATYMQLQ